MKPPWLERAENEKEVAEVPGAGSNPRILEYHAETQLKATDDNVPWCSAFVCAMMEWSGIPSTRSAAARSWLEWGRKIDKPMVGCIVILTRPPSETSGHVGFYMAETASTLFLLGGNQKDRVCVQEYPKSRVLGYRMPPLEYWKQEYDEAIRTSLSHS